MERIREIKVKSVEELAKKVKDIISSGIVNTISLFNFDYIMNYTSYNGLVRLDVLDKNDISVEEDNITHQCHLCVKQYGIGAYVVIPFTRAEFDLGCGGIAVKYVYEGDVI